LRTLTRVITTYAVVKKSTYVTTLALDNDYLEKLEESMPRRLLEVIERESTCTKY
jgi:hypothetical protein